MHMAWFTVIALFFRLEMTSTRQEKNVRNKIVALLDMRWIP